MQSLLFTPSCRILLTRPKRQVADIKTACRDNSNYDYHKKWHYLRSSSRCNLFAVDLNQHRLIRHSWVMDWNSNVASTCAHFHSLNYSLTTLSTLSSLHLLNYISSVNHDVAITIGVTLLKKKNLTFQRTSCDEVRGRS